MMLGEWELENGKRVMKYSCEFLTYKTEWDNIKEELGLSDEELRIAIGQELQLNAWGDVLPGVREFILSDRELAEKEKNKK